MCVCVCCILISAEDFAEKKQQMKSRRRQMAPATVNNKRRRAVMPVWMWNQPHHCSTSTHSQLAPPLQTPATRLTKRMASALHNTENNNTGAMPILSLIFVPGISDLLSPWILPKIFIFYTARTYTFVIPSSKQKHTTGSLTHTHTHTHTHTYDQQQLQTKSNWARHISC